MSGTVSLLETIRLEAVGATDIGQARHHNEDCLGDQAANYSDRWASHGHLFAVADGMGGHAKGEVASAKAIETLFDVYYGAPADDLAMSLCAAVEAANSNVFRLGRQIEGGIGTTLTVALLHGSTLMLANVGDSRIYRRRAGRLQLLTRDHSLVAEQVRRGLLTEEQARVSQSRNVLLRCVGYQAAVEVDLTESPLKVDDVLLLCSDGLHGVLSHEEIVTVLDTFPLAESPAELIRLANEHGGPDNITCLLVRVLELPGPPIDAEPEGGPAAHETPAGSDEVVASPPVSRRKRTGRAARPT